MDETGVMLSMLASVKVLVSGRPISQAHGHLASQVASGQLDDLSRPGLALRLLRLRLHRLQDRLRHARDARVAQVLPRERRFIMSSTFAHFPQAPAIRCRSLRPAKGGYRDKVERLERGGIRTVKKEHFIYLYSPARDTALTARNIWAGFRASGLYPFNSDRVHADLSESRSEEPDSVGVCDMRRESSQTDPQPWSTTMPSRPATPFTPATPATPTTAQALTFLQTTIEREGQSLEDGKQERLKKRLSTQLRGLSPSAACLKVEPSS